MKADNDNGNGLWAKMTVKDRRDKIFIGIMPPLESSQRYFLQLFLTPSERVLVLKSFWVQNAGNKPAVES